MGSMKGAIPFSDVLEIMSRGLRMRSATIPAKRDRPRLGRNDKCRCGSGMKYKRCCWMKDNAGD